MRVILLGPPGSGKRGLAKKLASRFDLKYLNLTELLTRMAREESSLGRLVGELMAACAPLPEELVSSVLNTALSDPGVRGRFIIDDYPRDVAHADILDRILDAQNMVIDQVIAMQVDADDLMERLVGKLTCDACGIDYNIYTNPPMVDGICDECGGRISRRPGDYEETISNRLRIYDGQSAQLVARYESQGLLARVRGTGDDARVFSACVKILEDAATRLAEAAKAAPQTAEPAPKARKGKGAAKAKAAAAEAVPAVAPVSEKAPAKKTAKKAVPEKAPTKKAPVKKAAAKKAPAKKAPAKQAAPEKASAKKVPAKKPPAKQAPAKKATAKKAPTKKVTAKKVSAKKAPATKAPVKKAPAKKAPAKKAPVKKAPAKKVAAKKAPAKKPAGKKAPAKKAAAKKGKR